MDSKGAQVKSQWSYKIVRDLIYLVFILVPIQIAAFEFNKLSNLDQSSVFIFYGPCASFLTMLWLWGVVIDHFEAHQGKYQACFSQEHQKYLLDSQGIYNLAAVLTTIFSISLCLFTSLCLRQNHDYLFGIVLATYMGLLLVFLAPINYLDYEVRYFFANTLRRTLLPFQEVYFSDFMLADILTSLARPFMDFAWSLCLLSNDYSTILVGVCKNRK